MQKKFVSGSCNDMKLSIIILNYKTKGLVRQCLKSIQLSPPSVSHEIIVVDNGSCDGIESMLREQFPLVRRIMLGKNRGYAAGNNEGILAASGDFLCILNPDITVRQGSIDTLVSRLENDGRIGMIGPKLLHPDGTLDESCYRFPSLLTPFYRRTLLGKTKKGKMAIDAYVMKDVENDVLRDVDWLLGAAIVVRRKAVNDVGLLDENFFLYFEDTDWCRRFHKKGWRVLYDPSVTMVHYHKRESAAGSFVTTLFRKTTRSHIASAIKYFWKWRKG